MKDFNALIDMKPFFDKPIKNKQKTVKNLLKCQEIMNNDDTTGNILGYLHHQNLL